MKTTGVIRRIDDLGRIVIPKEIRKTLRIKDGESLEFFLENDNIILKKYSSFENIESFYKNYVESIQDEIGENIVITDRDKIVAVAGNLKKKYLNKRISPFFETIINNRKNVFKLKTDEIEIVDGIIENCSCVISIIISNGDTIGSVILISTERDLTDLDKKIIIIMGKFLGKYIEQ